GSRPLEIQVCADVCEGNPQRASSRTPHRHRCRRGVASSDIDGVSQLVQRHAYQPGDLCTDSMFLIWFVLLATFFQAPGRVQRRPADQIYQTASQRASRRTPRAAVCATVSRQASLAERGLDSHRRDFHTFLLKGMARRLTGSTIEISPESFISFIVQYLAIFEECAVDPIHEPYILATEEELRSKCASAAEIAELVGNRAKAKEVRFLGNHVEEAKKKASGLRQKWKKVTHVPRKVLRLTGLGRWVKRRKNPKTGDEEEGSFGTFSHGAVAEPRELKWFRIDIGCGIGIETAGDEDEGSFPVQIHGFLFSCTVLSPEHVQLLVSIVTGIPLLILSCVAVREYSRALTCSIAVALLCTSFVLYDFLEIDAVQRMEIQIQEMQAAVAMVQQRRERMLEFFGKLHQLADLWLYRTLPRLEFMKMLSESLQDAEDADMAKHLQEIVAKVGILEDSLMPLSAWESDQMSRETKKGLADSITRLTRSSADDALKQVPTVSKEMSEMKIRLLAAPPQGAEA
ncbi:unnamed protein product, partial [Symbiodinium sp. KB8]